MALDWQQLAVWAIGAGAVLYLVWGYVAGRRRGACGGCHGCAAPDDEAPGTAVLVQIEPGPPRRKDA